MSQEEKPSTKPIAQKLGVRPGLKVCTIGEPPSSKLARQLMRAIGKAGRISAFKDLQAFRRWPAAPWDLVMAWVQDRRELESILPETRARIEQKGAIWIAIPRVDSFPKGISPSISQEDIFKSAPRAGLVDVKQAKISDTHYALKLVIPLAERRRT